AAAVGLRDFQAVNTTDALTEYLRPRRVLLILDNCEHLVSACADLVAHLLRFCVDLKVLTTSREPLAISGESTWRVLPLQLPETVDPCSLRDITPTAAMDLFAARAQAVNHTLELTDD